MRKLAACLLLMVFLFQAGIYYPLFFLRRAEIRQQVRSIILSEPQAWQQATVFVFTLQEWDQIHWLEREREFRHDGRMFDVISIQQDAPDRIRVVALEDGREMALYRELSQKQETQKSHAGRTNLGNLTPFFEHPEGVRLNYIPCTGEMILGFRETEIPASFFEVPAPPPWPA